MLSRTLTIANHDKRRGYTLLELVIALGLMGALMSVAWSLMATFRDAEERGWKITHRTQVIRAAHEWLQSDAQQITDSPTHLPFVGSRLGFTANIAPSLDPLPFLQHLMDEQSPTTDEVRKEEELTDDSPWNREVVMIEYQLQPLDRGDSLGSADAKIAAGNPTTDEMQFVLTRRELLSAELNGDEFEPFAQSLGGPLTEMQSVSPSDRLLTGQDLYRQEERPTSTDAVPISQSRLEGLVRPQFQYSDGKSWRSNWNSRSNGGFPVAIAIRFDFPARAQMRVAKPGSVGSDLDSLGRFGSDDSLDLSMALSAADMAIAGDGEAELESDGELSLMESDEFEVAIIVALNRGERLSTIDSSRLESSLPNEGINETSFGVSSQTQGQSLDSARGDF